MFKYSDVKIAGKGGMCGGKNAVLQGFAFHCPQGEGYTSQETNTQAKKQTSKQASKVLKGRVTQVTQVKPPAFPPQIFQQELFSLTCTLFGPRPIFAFLFNSVNIETNRQAKTSQELRMLSPSLSIQRSQCNCPYCCSQLSEM